MVTFLVVVVLLESHVWNVWVENFIALLFAIDASTMAYQIDKVGVFKILAV